MSFHPPGFVDSQPNETPDRDTSRDNLEPGQLYNVTVQPENYLEDVGYLEVRTSKF